MEYDELKIQSDYFHTTKMLHHSIVIGVDFVLPPEF